MTAGNGWPFCDFRNNSAISAIYKMSQSTRSDGKMLMISYWMEKSKKWKNVYFGEVLVYLKFCK